DARAVDHAAEDVAPELIGTEEVGVRRRLEPRVEVGFDGTVRRDDRREEGNEDQHRQEDRAEEGGAVATHPAQGPQPAAVSHDQAPGDVPPDRESLLRPNHDRTSSVIPAASEAAGAIDLAAVARRLTEEGAAARRLGAPNARQD